MPDRTNTKFGRELPESVTQVYGDLRGRMDGDLQAICFAEDGSVCSVEEGGILRRWEPGTGAQVDFFVLSEVEGCWSFSPGGNQLASGSNGISIWDVQSHHLLGQLNDPSWMLTIAFSPDGATIASGHDDQSVRLWDARTGKQLFQLRGHSDEISALAFSADGNYLATAGEDRLVILWEVATGKQVKELPGHTDRIDGLAWNHDGTRVASAGWDTSVRVWDPKSGELMAMLNGQGECVHCVAFLPGSEKLVCGDSECVVRVWDYAKLKPLAELRGHRGAVKMLAVRADGKQIASGGSDRSVQFWDIAAGKAVFDSSAPCTQVQMVAITPNEELVALHAEGLISCWDAASGKSLSQKEAAEGCVAVAASTKGKLALGTIDGTIQLRNQPSEKTSKTWRAHNNPTRLLAFSPDGEILASSASTDGTVKLWNVADGEAVLVIPEATENCTVEAIAFHPKEKILAAAGINWLGRSEDDGVIVLWNWEVPCRVRVLTGGASRLAFSPDGKLLVTVGVLNESVVVWDVESGTIVQELSGRDAATNAVAIDPQGRYVASGSDDFGLRVWETTDWSLIATEDLETSIKDLLFTPDGRGIISGNGNSTCYRISLEGLSSTG